MSNVQIVDLPAAGTLEGDELLIERDASGDKKVTLDALTDFIKNELTPTEILDLVKAAAPESNGLNANLLQGLAASFFQNANNLNSGTVSSSRLPDSDYGSSYIAAGTYPNAGLVRNYIRVNEAYFGERILIQWGWTPFINENTSTTVNFPAAFASGWSSDNTPMVIVGPECRSSEYPSGNPTPENAVELNIAVISASLISFTANSIRIKGNNNTMTPGVNDTVRANWIAFGRY